MDDTIEPLALGVAFDFAAANAQLDKFYANIEAKLKQAFAVQVKPPAIAAGATGAARASGAATDPKVQQRAADAAAAAAIRAVKEQERAMAALGPALAEVAARADAAEAALARYAASGSRSESLIVNYREQAREIKRLGELTGNAEMEARALSAAQNRLGRDLAAAGQSGRAAADSQVTATVRATQETGNLKQGVTQLGYQLTDVAVQLQGGQNPFTILVQQGPQIVQAMDMAGGATALFQGVLAKASAAMASFGPAIAIVAVALAGLATTYAVVGNATYDATESQAAYLRSTEQVEARAARLAEALRDVGDAQKETNATFADVTNQLGVVRGEIKDYEAAAASAADRVRKGAQSEIDARTQVVSSAAQEIAAIEKIIAAQGTSDEESVRARKRRAELIVVQREGTQAIRDLVTETDREAWALFDATVAAGQAAEAEEKLRKAKEARRKAEEDERNRLKGIADARAELNAAEAEGALAGASASVRLVASREQELRGLEKIRAEAMGLAKTEAERLAIEADYTGAHYATLRKYETERVAGLKEATAAILDSTRQRTESMATAEEKAAMAYATTIDSLKEQEAAARSWADTVEEVAAVEAAAHDARMAAYRQAVGEIVPAEKKEEKSYKDRANAAKEAAQQQVFTLYKRQADMIAIARSDSERLEIYRATDKAIEEVGRAYNVKLAAIQKERVEAAVQATMLIGRAVLDSSMQIAGQLASQMASTAGAGLQEARAQIGELDRLMQGFAVKGEQAAKLVGDALYVAYKEGRVSAEDLSKTQQQEIANQLYAEKKAAEEREAQQKKAALTAFRVQKAAAVTTATINAIIEVSQAAASAAWPFNIPAIAAATISGGARIALAASTPPPKFHSGTLYVDGPRARGLDSSEVPAVLQRGEAVVSRSAMSIPGAKEAVRNVMQGRPGWNAEGAVRPQDISAGFDGSSAPDLLSKILKSLDTLPYRMPRGVLGIIPDMEPKKKKVSRVGWRRRG